MPLTFVQRIESVARRIQRRRWMAAACWTFAALGAVLIGLMLLDRHLGVYSLAGRVVLTALLAFALIAIGRQAWRATRGRTTPLDVALELERRNPEHRSLFASGLQFSQQEGDDPTAGSLDLRRAVVLRASLAAEAIDVNAAVPRAPLRRAVIAALIAFFALADLAGVPGILSTGVVRLLNPFSDAEWPRQHDLAFDDPPSLLPIGGDFYTTLRDRRGTLPESIEVEYRTRRQGRWHYQTQTYAADADTSAVEVRLPNVQESFEFRARGGDHASMPWRSVETAPAPQVESLAVTVHPPAYTGLSAETGADPLRVFAGSTLTLRGATTLPIKTATLQTDGQADEPLIVASDNQSFTTDTTQWRPEKTADWSFSFTTPQGMSAIEERRLSVEVIPDHPPTVQIIAPTEDLFVLPEAKIDVEVEAQDDLAVQSLSLSIEPEQPADDQVAPPPIELYHGPTTPASGVQHASHVLDLSPLPPLIGSTWQVHAIARDYAGQESKSPRPLRLRIISREEFANRVDALQSRLAAALQRAHAHQQEARQRIEQWQAPSSPPTGGHALAALSRQRQVGEALVGGPDSATQLAKILIAEYRRNQWPEDDARLQIQRIVDELNALKSNQLASIETMLTALARNARSDDTSPTAAASAAHAAALPAIAAEQDFVLAALEAMIRSLSQSGELQQFKRELAELKDEQTSNRKQTEALAREALQPDSKLPTDESERRRQQAVDKQRELAARLTNTLGRMRQASTELTATKPSDAARLEAVAAASEKERMQGEIQAAAEQLAAGRLSQAAESQRRTEKQLEQLQQALREKQPIEKLETALGQLVAAQQAIVEETLQRGRSSETAKQLAKRQAAVREQAAVQAGDLERFPVFARLLRAAADTMQQAERRLSEGDAGEETVQLESRALDGLQRLADAVRQQRQPPPQPPKPNQPQPPRAGDNADSKKNDSKQVQALQLAVAQLGLLRTMQVDLQERTRELERSHAAGEIDENSLNEQSVELATEQRELTELAATLVQEATQPPLPRKNSLLPDPAEVLRRAMEEDAESNDSE
ncbi:MAG: hypothetical protein H0T51_12210 [Pirellulales bacterium]|nr:hypothetical protein [Pirellulales bacterium]